MFYYAGTSLFLALRYLSCYVVVSVCFTGYLYGKTLVMRYFSVMVLLFLMTACRQTPQREAGPDSRDAEQEQEAPAERSVDSVQPQIADIPDDEVPVGREIDTVFRYFGRTLRLDQGGAELVGSASSVRFRASGDTVWVELEVPGKEHAYALITRNDKLSWKYRLVGGQRAVLAIPLEHGQQWNELEVYKLTEAVNGAIVFHGATAEGLSRSTYSPEVNIEFIGNSVTCGYGVDQGQIPCGSDTYYDQHNPYEAFAAKAARTMGAGYNLSSVSGVGMYRNYNEKDILTMPERYTDLYLDGRNLASWPPENWEPDMVCICLGTNDLNAVRNDASVDFDPEAFVRAYIYFIEGLRVMYPSAAFVLLDSPMVSASDNEILYASLEKVRDHFSNGVIIRVMQFDRAGLSGCEGHPGMRDHDAMARQVRSFLIRTLDEIVGEDEATMS